MACRSCERQLQRAWYAHDRRVGRVTNFMPNAPASQIERLIDAGAIVLAKTNLHEFAYGITTVGSIFGRTRNPYDAQGAGRLQWRYRCCSRSKFWCGGPRI